ncbi:nitroreductase family protein [Lentzea sp. NPDC092896]|uniref:nitroreductase family protein n=1 Tax=Lentzea sp. NPDC092896 TaxID=3364127 RepID=UPI003816C3FE
MQLEDALTTTRAVRRRLDLERPVDLEIVLRCLETALQAPTGGDRQAWRFVVVTEPDLRAEVGRIYRRCFEERTRGAAGRTYENAQHLATVMERVPVQIIPCVEVPGGHLPPRNQASLWAGLLPAVWSYMLAARGHGLGTCWTTAHLAAEEEVAALLGIPDGTRQAALIPTAHTLGATFLPARRRPLGDVLHLNGWTTREPAST